SYTNEPVMSDGRRSGVNWMRLKRMPTAWAKQRAISVLARPGKSSSSTWPPESRPSSTSSSTARLPTMARSTSSSSRWLRSLVSARLSSSPVTSDLLQEVGQADDVIAAQGLALARGRLEQDGQLGIELCVARAPRVDAAPLAQAAQHA